MNSDDTIVNWLESNPKVKEELAATGVDPVSAVKAQISGKLSAFEQVEKVGELKVKERTAAAHEASARNAGAKGEGAREDKQFTDAKKAFETTYNNARRTIAASNFRAANDNKLLNQLVMEQADVQGAFNYIKDTWGIDPITGKKVGESGKADKYGTLTDKQLNMLLNKL